MEKLVEERIKENMDLFNKKELGIIKENIGLVEKIYLLSCMDAKYLQ